MRKTVWILMAVGFGLLPLAARAHDDESEHKGRMDRKMGKLELTSDQQAKMKVIGQDQGRTMGALHETFKIRMDELRLLVDSKASDDKLTAKVAEVKAAFEAMEAGRRKFMEQRSAVLTPMQRARATLRMGHMMREGRMGGWGENGNKGGGKRKGGKEGHEGHDGDEEHEHHD